MELYKRVELIDTLLEEAEHKRYALTHALPAKERGEQGREFTHDAPLPAEEQGLQYEHNLWQQVEIGLTDTRKRLAEMRHWNGSAASVRKENRMEPRRRTHLVNELMDEATLMQNALHKSLEAKQTQGQAKTPAASSLREEYASWERVLQGLKVIQAELDRIEHAERARIDR